MSWPSSTRWSGGMANSSEFSSRSPQILAVFPKIKQAVRSCVPISYSAPGFSCTAVWERNFSGNPGVVPGL
jgi:hypothetical protein